MSILGTGHIKKCIGLWMCFIALPTLAEIVPVDKTQKKITTPGRVYERPQSNWRELQRICEHTSHTGCLIIRKFTGYRVGFLYYMTGDINARRHEYDHWIYGPRHETLR